MLKITIFPEFLIKIRNSLMKNFRKHQFRFAQSTGNLVDLEKRCKMSIWLQNLALTQPRTSPLKFEHLAEQSENDTVSNLAPKAIAGYGRPAQSATQPRSPSPSFAAGPYGAIARDARFDREPAGTVSFESLNHQNLGKFLSEFRKFC